MFTEIDSPLIKPKNPNKLPPKENKKEDEDKSESEKESENDSPEEDPNEVQSETDMQEKPINGQNITEHRDPIDMMKDNIVIFLNKNGTAYYKQSQNLLQ